MLRPQFARQQYQDLDVLRDHVNDLIKCIKDGPETVDLQPQTYNRSFSASHSILPQLFCLVNRHIVLRANKSGEDLTFAADFDIAQDYVVQRYRYLDLYWLIGGRRFREACTSVHLFIEKIIEKRQSRIVQSEGKVDRYVFIYAIADDSQDRKAVRDQLLNILLAGRDTTACLLSWTFYLLSCHPNVLKKLRDEIAFVAGANMDLKREDLKKMIYLADVLKETLRLYPSVPVNTRTVHRTTTLPRGGGPDGLSPVLVRKGDNIAFCVHAMHRRKDLFGEDAKEFRPERWDENLPLHQDEINMTWGFLPFNGGPRVCLGQDFGLTEASYAVVRILQTFPHIEAGEFGRPQSQPWLGYSSHNSKPIRKVAKHRQKMTLVLSAKDGCPIKAR